MKGEGVMSSLPKRQDLDPKYTWDLSRLYESQEAFEAAFDKVRQGSRDFKAKYAGQIESPADLLDSLRAFNQLSQDLSWLVAYGRLGYEVDKTHSDYERNIQQLGRLMEEVNQDLAFYKLEVAGLEDAILEAVAGSESGQAFAANLRQIQAEKDHYLTLDNETLLSALGGSLSGYYAHYEVVKFQDMVFDDFQAGHETYANSFASFEQHYEGHTDQAVRHGAWKSFHEGLSRYRYTVGHNYIQHVQTEKKLATLRGFDSVFDYLLDRQDVSLDVYNQVIDTYMEEFAPVMRRYAGLLQKKHQLDAMSLADIKIPYSTDPVDTVSVEEAEALLLDAFQVLGEDYLQVFRQAFEERWIDYPMSQTKSTGGFCNSVYQGPKYILLNWTGLLSEVLVLAHELGHAVHAALAEGHNVAMAPKTSMFFIEAPSTANEVIMCAYLLKSPLDESVKQNLVAEFISRTYFHNMVTHLIEADFQRKVYKAVDRGEVLNVDRLDAFFQASLQTFWGDALTINPGAEMTWMRQPHYYMGLYPYTYSAGLTIGTQVGEAIVNGDKKMLADWLEVLQQGGSQSPMDLIQSLGIDMAGKEALRQTIDYVDRLVDRL